jgi:hypothetical protein
MRFGLAGLRPEIFDRIGTAEFEWNQVINLVIAGAVRCDAVFAVNLALHFRRYIAHFSGVSGSADILSCDIERAAGGQIRIGKNWRGLLSEDDPSKKQEKSECSNVHRGAF